MDFATLNMKFGEGTVWTCKFKCGWCSKPLKNQTEERFKISGNCCSECNTLYAKIAMEENKESEISHRDRLIRQTRLEADIIRVQLNEPISKSKEKELHDLLERKMIKIKMLKDE